MKFTRLSGAGAAEGAVDAANILKPVLARGEIQVIGATTIAEYRRHIEKDAGTGTALPVRSCFGTGRGTDAGYLEGAPSEV